ncbi:MAG: hypothetical protein QOD50_577, partial [Actinomycetota bacterium]|nr:hypothetical protein [Actinomycetota bacterium]
MTARREKKIAKQLTCRTLSSRQNQFGVPVVGLEPTRPFEQSILSAPRLPFRHTGA